MIERGVAERLSATELSIIRQVEAKVDDSLAFLERVVNINSGTMNHDGVRLVGRAFESEFQELGFATRWIPLTHLNRAGHLFAERSGTRGKRILLIGHLDTVFEKNSTFQRFENLGDTARGPGVEDMKGGDVVLLFALKAMHAAGVLEGAQIIVALIGDEEDSGDPVTVSRGELIEAAKRCQVGLGFESAGLDHHNATVARRGYSEWRLSVAGQQGHSSRIFHPNFGSGAIYEAARVLSQFHEQLGAIKHLTLGPGIILGGTDVSYDPAHTRGGAFGKTNVIPKTVVAAGDLRFNNREQLIQTQSKMREIVTANLPRTSSQITFRDSYPAMPPAPGNYDLMDQLDRVSRDLGFGPVKAFDPDERGAADIAFAADHVEACLDGLGPAGWGGHSPDETIDLRSFPIQIKRAALLIHRLAGGD